MEKRESLFWQVYKNKVLVNKIFEQISNCVNGIKFKYIFKLGWFIKNKQFQLLKCKLINKEVIQVNEESLKSLFSIETIDSAETQPSSFSIEISKEIIGLLLSVNSIKAYDLISIVLECSNYQTINTILQLLGNGETFETIILNSVNEQDKTNYTNYFKSIILNKKYGCELLVKLSNVLVTPLKPSIDYFSIYSNPLEIDINELTSNISNFIEGQLFDSNENQQELIEYISIFIRLLNIPENQLPLDNQALEIGEKNEIIKQKLKQLIQVSSSVQLNEIYLKRYDQVIPGLMVLEKFEIQILDYCFKQFSLNILESLQFNYSNTLKNDILPKFEIHPNFVPKNTAKCIDFLQLFLLKVVHVSQQQKVIGVPIGKIKALNITLEHLSVILIHYVLFGIDNETTYQSVVNGIPDQFKKFLPIKWNSIIADNINLKEDKLLFIDNIETMIWVNHSKTILKNTIHRFNSIFKPSFETFELAQMAQIHIPDRDLQTFKFVLLKAIKECDFKIMESILSLSNGFRYIYIYFGSEYFEMKPLSYIQFNKSASLQEYNNLFNYIIGNRIITEDSVLGLVKFITSNGYYDDYEPPCSPLFFNLSKIKFKFFNSLTTDHEDNEIENDYQIIFWSNIIVYHFKNLKLTRFILENVFLVCHIDHFEHDIMRDPMFKRTKCLESFTSFKEIQELVKLFIIHHNRLRLEDGLKSPLIYYRYLNGLFHSLLQCNDITFNQVDELYQLLYENSIPIDYPKIINLIYIQIRIPNIVSNYYSQLKNNSSVLDSEILQLEFIKNSSIHQLLESILYYDKNKYNMMINLNFLLNSCFVTETYYIESIFLKEIEIIKNQNGGVFDLIYFGIEFLKPICELLDLDSFKLLVNSFPKSKSNQHVDLNWQRLKFEHPKHFNILLDHSKQFDYLGNIPN